MGIKKKLGMGIASAVLGVSLIGGGTFAYFSDSAVQANEFSSGTLDLSVEPEVQVKMDNLKPGDWMPRTFDLQNDGSLGIKYVELETAYKVTRDGQNVGTTLADEYAEALQVQFLNNTTGDKDKNIIYETSLKDLSTLTPDDLATRIDKEYFWIFPFFTEYEGIDAGDTANFDVKFVFKDDGDDQNHLQDLDLDLTWTFTGHQEDGEEK